eukprot:TRINITY_DN5470_c0_g1_i2.p1 TRINITY_DN5470_c0_g1~~TRINITY_DN5470_c0_g1_i2.p1  ORF type:complete len:106 (+),score=28.39 TRINITY_DN5470_c0_g1_i2:71-388(+)
MSHTHPLEGDGTQVNLFHYLWKKGQGLEDQKLKFKIPDTIVFYNFPIIWYYWSESQQEIRKKGGKELERSNILQGGFTEFLFLSILFFRPQFIKKKKKKKNPLGA